MRWIIPLLLLLSSPAWAQRSYTTPYQTPYLSWCPGGSCIGNLNLGRFDLVLADDIYETVRTSDAAAYDLSIMAGSAYPRAAVNTGGANLTLMSGIGQRYITVTNVAISEGDQVSVTINGTAVTKTAKNPGPAGADQFLCITNVGTCATALAAAFSATSGVTATASGAVVYFEPTAGSTVTLSQAITDGAADGAFGTPTNGADGQLLLPDGTQTLPGWTFYLDRDTGIFRGSANVMRLVTGGSTKISVEGNIEMYTHLDMNGFIVYGNSRREIPSADLAVGSCSVYNESFDTGGATVEWCYCRVANAWFCLPSGTVNGPVD